MKISYTVEETTGVIVKGDNVSDWETIPLWQVYRYSGNMGSAVAKYRDKEIADQVADFLTANAGMEGS